MTTQLLKFRIEVSRYPLTYEVEAMSKSDAESKARELFNDETSGETVYEINTTAV